MVNVVTDFAASVRAVNGAFGIPNPTLVGGNLVTVFVTGAVFFIQRKLPMRVLNLTPTSRSFCDLLRRRRGAHNLVFTTSTFSSRLNCRSNGFSATWVAFLRGSSKLFGEMSPGSNQETVLGLLQLAEIALRLTLH